MSDDQAYEIRHNGVPGQRSSGIRAILFAFVDERAQTTLIE
jgi:hypothetical protein